jgi:hypothetical protein
MLKNSLDGVDRDLLRKAVAAGLQNQDGRARGEVGAIYQRLSYEEIKPLLPAIHEAIVTPAPSGEMFASGIRLSGLELLAKHRIREGMDALPGRHGDRQWGKQDRIKRALKALATYGAAAKPARPLGGQGTPTRRRTTPNHHPGHRSRGRNRRTALS